MSEMSVDCASILCAHPNSHFVPPLPNEDVLQQHALPRHPISLPERTLAFPGLSPKKLHQVSRMTTYIRRLLDHLGISPSETYIVDVGAGQGYLCRSLNSLLHCPNILALDSDADQSSGARARDQNFRSTDILHKTIHITPHSLLKAVDQWIPPNNNNAKVLLVALHACGSLTIDTLRAFIASQANNSRWSFIATIVVGCCYNLLNPTDFPLCKTIDFAAQASLTAPGNPLPPSAYHLAAQSPPQWSLPSFELSVRKVVWRALISPLLEGVRTEETRPFIPPSEYTSYVKERDTKTPLPRRNLQTISAPRPQINSVNGVGTPDTDIGDTGTSLAHQRLGRLPNSAYTSWKGFIDAVEERLGVSLGLDTTLAGESLPRYTSTSASSIPIGSSSSQQPTRLDSSPNDTDNANLKNINTHPSSQLAKSLAHLHITRCKLGPVIESVILKDRIAWVREELGLDLELEEGVSPVKLSESDDVDSSLGKQDLKQDKQPKWDASLVNLFDQAQGSPRNVAIVVVPGWLGVGALEKEREREVDDVEKEEKE
ncbi:hypothetical protein D9758_013585 [Tetrapyrgos nigripes]|uniref:Methyltransferase domain-containing protein n=1 Tax=Tetrapyrgos nigripes TaxID=182062 RepID=A0A8H5CBG4_9AGAR|nr:hypothetical protein D9758_013585 [Tetrapyrgos nigripes]